MSARDLFFTKRLYFSNAPQLTRKQPALLQTSSRNGAISLSNKVVLDFFSSVHDHCTSKYTFIPMRKIENSKRVL